MMFSAANILHAKVLSDARMNRFSRIDKKDAAI